VWLQLETGCQVCGTSQFFTLRHRRFSGDSALRCSTFHVLESQQLRNSEGGVDLRFNLRLCVLRFHRSEITLKCLQYWGRRLYVTLAVNTMRLHEDDACLDIVHREKKKVESRRVCSLPRGPSSAREPRVSHHTVHLLDRPVCRRLGTIFTSRQSLLIEAPFRAE
jgi:hypothetical protein